jgi:hypothetical protein
MAERPLMVTRGWSREARSPVLDTEFERLFVAGLCALEQDPLCVVTRHGGAPSFRDPPLPSLGSDIAAVAEQVRARVRRQVHQLTGVTVHEVNVTVIDVIQPR